MIDGHVTQSVARRAAWRPAPFATLLTCAGGRVLVRAGEPARNVYLIRRGQARAYVLSSDGRETTTAVLGAGQLFGISPLLGQDTYHEFVEALGDLETWGLPTDCLLQELTTNRDLLGLMIGAVAQRFAQGVTLLADITLGSASERAANVEGLLQRQLGEAPKLNKRRFSDLIGVRPETLSRVSRRPRPAPATVHNGLPAVRADRAPAPIHDLAGLHSADDVDVLTALAGLEPQSFAAGETIPLFGDQVYVLKRGRIRLLVADARGRRIVFEPAARGFFGLPPIVHNHHLELMAEVLSPALVWALAPKDMLGLLDADPALCWRVLGETADRLVRVEGLLHRAHAPTARARVVSLLLEVGRLEGQVHHDGSVQLPRRWTHQALAEALGARRETVTRALRQLSLQGQVSRSGQHLLICDPRRLARLAEPERV